MASVCRQVIVWINVDYGSILPGQQPPVPTPWLPNFTVFPNNLWWPEALTTATRSHKSKNTDRHLIVN